MATLLAYRKAGVAGRILRLGLAGLPVLASIVAVNALTLPGVHDRVFAWGAVGPSWTGLHFGLLTALRLFAASAAVAAVFLHGSASDILDELEERGLGRRPAYVLGGAAIAVPALARRAGQIVDAQRARGLDTEGGWWRRLRGLMPLLAPLVTGSLLEVEARTMALEARAFSAPGRRSRIRPGADSGAQRLIRWAAVLVTVAAIAARLRGLALL